MAVVMKLCGDAFGRATPWDGQYLHDFDFEAAEGQGEITMTANIQRARMFADLAEAIEFRGRSPECRPLRDDGQPNRPLTSTTWQFVTLEGR